MGCAKLELFHLARRLRAPKSAWVIREEIVYLQANMPVIIGKSIAAAKAVRDQKIRSVLFTLDSQCIASKISSTMALRDAKSAP